ncbi:HAMP domain-containing sensor histidine kinase [Variovorax sp. J31P179]|uniref:sensor histidine kinase n=1 Tax=Variovorax sp. J31P179 TaxID=3053508 RepID=UPI0025791762|nr:HAMP domain-containing sensor histidine kinase [Variovorax sp. J31P179]
MSAELIGRSPEVQVSPRLSRAADTIRRTVHAQAQIIDDLLDLSRLQTGKLTLSRSPVKWRPIIEWITDALRKDAQTKQIALAVEAEDLSIFADVVRVEQIFWNLVSNALKFTPPGGTVHVRLTRDGPWALLEVQDSGRGIEPSFLGQVFDMFRQGDHKPTTRREGGMRIGLALVKSWRNSMAAASKRIRKAPARAPCSRYACRCWRAPSAARSLASNWFRAGPWQDNAGAEPKRGRRRWRCCDASMRQARAGPARPPEALRHQGFSLTS